MQDVEIQRACTIQLVVNFNNAPTQMPNRLAFLMLPGRCFSPCQVLPPCVLWDSTCADCVMASTDLPMTAGSTRFHTLVTKV